MSKDILAQLTTPDDGSKAIEAIVNSPCGCPWCYSERGEAFPPNYSTRLCPRHAAVLRKGSAEDLARYAIQHRNNPRPVFSDSEVQGWMLDSLLMVCDTAEELCFRLTQLALARSETIAYSHGL
jgi:hypothetical protein